MTRLVLTLSITFALATAPVGAASPEGAATWEIYAQVQEGPGNIAVGPDGRVFLSLHQFFQPTFRVVEVSRDGTLKPYPNETWAKSPGPDGVGLNAVLGIRADAQHRLWMLDNGGAVPKLVVWDTLADRLAHVIYLPPPHVSPPGAFHNDLALDPANARAYLADVGIGGRPGIVVVNLNTGLSRRVLEGHPSVQAEPNAPIEIDGKRPTMIRDGKPVQPRVALNPITIDPAGEWVYYGAMNGNTLWRVPAKALADDRLSPEELAGQVQRYGDKPPSDGISVDSAGNVYITDVNASGIGVTGKDGTYRLLFSDPRLSWPDAISAGPDGWMYVACNQLHLSPALNAGVNEARPPFLIIRFRPLAESAVGR